MLNRLQHLRYQAYKKQNGFCYYCSMPMWNHSPTELAVRYQVSATRVKPLKCTAEHLQAKCDGGKDTLANIVAACHYCNKHRHITKSPRDPQSYQKKVKSRMNKNAWTSILIPNLY